MTKALGDSLSKIAVSPGDMKKLATFTLPSYCGTKVYMLLVHCVLHSIAVTLILRAPAPRADVRLPAWQSPKPKALMVLW